MRTGLYKFGKETIWWIEQIKSSFIQQIGNKCPLCAWIYTGCYIDKGEQNIVYLLPAVQERDSKKLTHEYIYI